MELVKSTYLSELPDHQFTGWTKEDKIFLWKSLLALPLCVCCMGHVKKI